MCDKVIFRNEDHSYRCGDILYRSVSSVIEPYKGFDKEASSIRLALKELDPERYSELSAAHGYKSATIIHLMLPYVDMDELEEVAARLREEWKQKGRDATDNGTLIHAAKEKEDIDRGFIIGPDGKEYQHIVLESEYDNEGVCDLGALAPGCYTELLIFDHDLRIAGQADRVFITEDGVFHIDDWKTDEKVEKKGFYTRRYGYAMLKEPLNHIHDCNFWIYALKISMYAYMLERAGFTVGQLLFNHISKEDGTFIARYDVPYLKDDLKKILIITSEYAYTL